ncbi:hypothetical protein UFOVP75_40 [uncultured Caudovirales phage]|uniref:Uncharacterized protein n=1 Tax=uncultured Caudovirales phage TaxID=2100421 RepID=A0A6J5L2X0_9CAUD|nr:hypothetical protein UFOVP75_40 [uncultured Caudovirales phage]
MKQSLNLTITEAHLLLGTGPDKITLTLDRETAASALGARISTWGDLTVHIEAPRGLGLQVLEKLGVPRDAVEVLDIRGPMF